MNNHKIFQLISVFIFIQFIFANTLYLSENDSGYWDVNYNSNDPIAGFQFNVDGTEVLSASGGDATSAGFMVSTGNDIVLGFSLTGATISEGMGTLLTMELTDTPTGLSGIIFSDPNGGNLNFIYDDCYPEVDLGCGCGESGPSGCDVVCGSTLENDECGVCGGDGISCTIYIIDVTYDSDTTIAGFQFGIEGSNLLNASGGLASEAGFMVSTGNNTVLGFSLAGATIPAGSGVLTTLEVEGPGTCIVDLILSDSL